MFSREKFLVDGFSYRYKCYDTRVKMGRILKSMLFFTVFFSAYLLGNFYILWRLFGLFGARRGWVFYTLVAVVTFSYIAAAFLDSVFANRATRNVVHADDFVDGGGIIFALRPFDL